MKYTVINNNKRNFKVQYEVDGLEQQAHLQGDTTHYGRLITGTHGYVLPVTRTPHVTPTARFTGQVKRSHSTI